MTSMNSISKSQKAEDIARLVVRDAHENLQPKLRDMNNISSTNLRIAENYSRIYLIF